MLVCLTPAVKIPGLRQVISASSGRSLFHLFRPRQSPVPAAPVRSESFDRSGYSSRAGASMRFGIRSFLELSPNRFRFRVDMKIPRSLP